MSINPHICPACGRLFNKIGRKQYCSQKCQHKAWETRNKERVLEAHRAKNNRYYQRFQDKLQTIKLSSGCVMCGYRKYPGALDFHHIDPTAKEQNIGRNPQSLEEIKKCAVLCSNCHRELHQMIKTQPEQAKTLLEAYMKNPVKIGEGTVIWRYVNLLPGASVGSKCTVGAYSEIGLNVKVGNGCKIENGVFIPKGVTIGNRVFLGPRTSFTNDRYPSSTDYGKFEQTNVEDDVSIGAGSVIRCGIVLGKGCKIGAGSVVTKDVAPGVTVYGNPAKEH